MLVGLEGGINLYAYVAGNPNKYIDPTGEFLASGAALLTYMYGPAILTAGTAAVYRLAPYSGAIVDFVSGCFTETGTPKGAGYICTGARYLYEEIKKRISQKEPDPCEN